MTEYRYYYTHSEANFGKPLKTEVAGGAHLVFDVIPWHRGRVHALRLPDGLHGDRKNALYFPHGLIRFGETTLQCADRLCREYANSAVTTTSLLWMSSWVDDNEHWHLCLNVLAHLASPPERRDFVSEIVAFTEDAIPNDFPWWTVEQLQSVFDIVRKLEPGSRD